MVLDWLVDAFVLSDIFIGSITYWPISNNDIIIYLLFSFSQDAIGCLASITDSSITKKILLSLLERFQFVDGEGDFEKMWSHNQALIDKEQRSLNSTEKDVQR